MAVLYTAVDRDAPFVRHADVAVRARRPDGEVRALSRSRARASRRCAPRVSTPCGRGGASSPRTRASPTGSLARDGDSSVHPARRCGRVGDKIAAKQAAERAGVPVAPWSGGLVADAASAIAIAERIGYPLLVKAAAGGGGQGIRVVEEHSELAAAFGSAAAEASAAFGDGRLFLERKIAGGRHIEVQIAADVHGNVTALGPGTARCNDATRRSSRGAAVGRVPGASSRDSPRRRCASPARSDTSGSELPEFLVADGDVYFLEINPRLQVEHGITEATTGLDLVQMQIRIGRDESLAGLQLGRARRRDRGARMRGRPGRRLPAGTWEDRPLRPRARTRHSRRRRHRRPAASSQRLRLAAREGDRHRRDTRGSAQPAWCAPSAISTSSSQGGASNTGFLIDLSSRPLSAVAASIPDGSTAASAGMSDAGHARRQMRSSRRPSSPTNAGDATCGSTSSPIRPALSASRVPPSIGQEIDLAHDGVGYRLEVFALGSWRYRVRCEGRTVSAVLREADAHLARLECGARMRRIV